jgi:O-antigen/teichoic acid export membrane protein
MTSYSKIYAKALDFVNSKKLKERAIRGAIFTIVGYASVQTIRLASNLILTRILFPEAFGLMAIIQVFMQGVAMFSDLGVGASIIQNKRGDDPVFLDTAWTLQVARGALLFIVIFLISTPISRIYNAPILAELMPVAGFSALIGGLMPTKVQTENKNLKLGYLTLMEITSQFLSVLIMISLALWSESIWALVFGGLSGSLIKLILVHKYINGRKNSFCWDRDSLRHLIDFGKWIFLGSIVGFFANQSDKLILASYMTKSELGVYSVAFGISSIFWVLHSKINHYIFFPIYSHFKDLKSSQLRPKIYKARLFMCSFLMPPIIILILLGDNLISFLYDERYAGAGWMMRILCVGYVVSIATNIGPFYLAQGNSKLMTKLIAVKAAVFVTCMIAGGEMYGVIGVLTGTVASHIVFYLIESSVYRHFGLWIWKLDAIFLSIVLAILGVDYFGVSATRYEFLSIE